MPKLTRKTAIVELADGRILTARVINPDVLRYEETARRLGWRLMTVEDGVADLGNLNQANTFQAYAALKRTGQYAGTWETFCGSDCVDLTVEEESVDPTQPAPDSDSSPSSHGSDAGRSPSSETQTTT